MLMLIRFAYHLLMAMLSLSVEPSVYHIGFPPDPDNSAVVLVISSNTNAKPYYQFDEVLILEMDATSVDIPRHALPHGGYHITAMLMKWVDGMEVAVDSADTIILVD